MSLSLVFAAALAVNACLPSKAHAQTPVWAEEFNGDSINVGNWVHDWGTGAQFGLYWGWGNGELQYYTDRPENARIDPAIGKDGALIIEAHRESFMGMPFTSARLKTQNRMSFKYGTLEARIRLPDIGNGVGNGGLWPAYWLLGATGVWPGRGEIDIMEAGSGEALAGDNANYWIGGATHWAVADGNYAGHYTSHIHDNDLSVDFHIYRLSWTPDFIRASIDDEEYFAFYIGPDADPAAGLEEFHRPHFLLLNLAVGGQYTGLMGEGDVTSPLPGRMEIDYVRLYQNETDHPGAELHLGQYAIVPPRRFGVFTERDDLNAALDFGDAHTNLFIWDGTLTSIDGATPYEGAEVLAFRSHGNHWFGFGIIDEALRNMSAYAGGELKFRMRIASQAPFRIGVSSAGGESWLVFDGTEEYGLARDGDWHEVTIPFSAFGPSLDLQTIRQMFMLVADAYPGDPVEFFIDDVYYLAPERDIFEDGFEPMDPE